MKTLPCPRTLMLFVFCLFLINTVQAQKLNQSRRTSYLTYVYSLTDKEAKKIYGRTIRVVDTNYFHTKIDSFPTDSEYKKSLPSGHYLKVWAEKNLVKCSITTVQNLDIALLGNNTDLCVHVYDTAGNSIPNARLKVRWKTLHYDEKTQTYLDRKSNQKGLLKVTYQGITSFYQLSRSYNNSCPVRISRKILFGTPLKYAWLPVDFVIHLPIDAGKSIYRLYPVGTISRTVNFFRNSFEKIACLFDDYYCNPNRYYNKCLRMHSGYIVFNKPKYMPGDTVKFKSFIVNRKGKPVAKSLDVVLYNRKKDIVLNTIKPYDKGGYEWHFVLHDSLDLQLDYDYNISLQKNDRRQFIYGSFIYEDYELSKNKLELRVGNTNQYRGNKLVVYAKGTDENDLNLLDARLTLIVRPVKPNLYFNTHVFLPDTLYYVKKDLSPEGETELVIPDSLFPPANFTYEATVVMLTSNNEVVTEKEKIDYYYSVKEFHAELGKDSILVTYSENGIPGTREATVYAMDNFEHSTMLQTITTPAKIKLVPYYSDYLIKSDSLQSKFDIWNEASLIKCFSQRTDDSLFFRIDNPRNIPFNYFIYKKNTEKYRGISDSLNLRKKEISDHTYFISLHYLWGGRMMNENYRVPYLDKMLHVEAFQPEIVYPGQEVKIQLRVTDQEGNPVPDVDLTAYSMTGKFDYTPPEIPYIGKIEKDKNVINNFSKKTPIIDDKSSLGLNYKKWSVSAGLDSIEYYNFIYPRGIYHFSYPTSNHITQFAPFVVTSGNLEAVHVIYVDNKPVYFSWSTNIQPYSFRISSGYHQIRIRTAKKEITVDSIYFSDGEKCIFSLNSDQVQHGVRIKDMDARLSEYEKKNLYRYIFPYRYPFRDRDAYIANGENIQLLKPVNPYGTYYNYAGPVNGDVTFRLVNDYSLNFGHEPFFEYDFAPQLLKMRSVDPNVKYPGYLYYKNAEENLSDEVFTQQLIIRQWEEYLDAQRYANPRYSYPTSTAAGAGRLQVNYIYHNKVHCKTPVNILLLRYDDPNFLRVYPGNELYYHQLSKGYYRIIFFYPEDNYQISDSIFVAPNGTTYQEIQEPNTLLKDSFSMYVNNLIRENLFKPVPVGSEEVKEMKQIYTSYQENFKYVGAGKLIEGYVYDNMHEPLPGVTILVKGTTFGTVTDINGYYSIKLPDYANTLVVNYVGFKTEEIHPDYENAGEIYLDEDIMALQEVVVVGYGVQKKSMLSGSVATVSNNKYLLQDMPYPESDLAYSLQGMAAGVTIVSNSGAPGGNLEIRVRGIATQSFNSAPLIIVDGNVFTGDISKLPPDLINNIKVLKDAAATAIYGSMGSNGVLIISTKTGTYQNIPAITGKGTTYDKTFYDAASQSSSIRENFSDYAFWKPGLTTDENGVAAFKTTFPDDVTSWNTYYLAMNDRRQSGQTQATIKSYKPLMAQLAVPRFLIQGDTSEIIGKTLNYSPDSVYVTTRFEVDSVEVFSKDRYCVNSILDTLAVAAGNDSLDIKYYLLKEDGFFDGEKKNIPVFARGLEETKGNFLVLDDDTTFTLQSDSTLGKVKIYARADILDIFGEEISRLITYKYWCNEQIASKLKALLAEKNISMYKGIRFNQDAKIEKMVRLLERNQKDRGLWGWWSESDTRFWISLHVLESISQAKQMGYKININENQIIDHIIWQFDYSPYSDQLRIMRILRLLNAPVDYNSFLKRLKKPNAQTLNDLLQLTELKQLCNLPYSPDTLKHYQKKTLFGNIYFADDNASSEIWENTTQNTLLAYRILKNDTSTEKAILKKIARYFLEERREGYWRNTYESAEIIETLLPDLLKHKGEMEKPVLKIIGDTTVTVTKFPFELEVDPKMHITLIKTGDFPVYLTSYQRFWDTQPQLKKEDFEIETQFNDQIKSFLTAGETIKLRAHVALHKDAEFVMINIPIPAGCSYVNKENSFRNEVHREYFKNETVIFCEYLKKGEYTFEIELIPRYSGKYTLNPAKIELMYFPVFNANNGIKKVEIK
jgi:alpha-2-macroglobulin